MEYVKTTSRRAEVKCAANTASTSLPLGAYGHRTKSEQPMRLVEAGPQGLITHDVKLAEPIDLSMRQRDYLAGADLLPLRLNGGDRKRLATLPHFQAENEIAHRKAGLMP